VSPSKLIQSSAASGGVDKLWDKGRFCAAHVSMLSSASKTAKFVDSSWLNPRWILAVLKSELNSPVQKSGHDWSSKTGVSLWMQLVEE